MPTDAFYALLVLAAIVEILRMMGGMFRVR